MRKGICRTGFRLWRLVNVAGAFELLPRPGTPGRGLGRGAEAKQSSNHSSRSMSNRNERSKVLLRRAREMRSQPNDAESSVWQGLRAKRLRGFKFRRQHPIGNYIVDFYCAAAMLVIELDGATHIGKESYDAMRQSWLESQGLLVIRFGNRELDQGIDEFLEIVWRHCVERTGSTRGSAPLPNPLPGVPGRGDKT